MVASFWPVLLGSATLGLAIVGALWAVMQAQFSAIINARSIKDTCIDGDLIVLRERLTLLESQVIGAVVFDEFKLAMRDNILVLRNQLSILEQTRPTTGELQGATAALGKTMDNIEDRVRSLEQRFNIPSVK